MRKFLSILLVLSISILLVSGCGSSKKAKNTTKTKKKIVLKLKTPNLAFDKYLESIKNVDIDTYMATLSEDHLEKLSETIDSNKKRFGLKTKEDAWKKYIEEEKKLWTDYKYKRHDVKHTSSTKAEINFNVKDCTKFTNVRVYLEKKENGWRILGRSRFNSSKYMLQKFK